MYRFAYFSNYGFEGTSDSVTLNFRFGLWHLLDTVTESLLSEFRNNLNWIGFVILFGTLLGEILAITGGADVEADSVIKVLGIKLLPLAMAVIGF